MEVNVCQQSPPLGHRQRQRQGFKPDLTIEQEDPPLSDHYMSDRTPV